jgi:hypothetical protein
MERPKPCTQVALRLANRVTLLAKFNGEFASD